MTTGEFTARSHAVACAIEAPPRFGMAALHVSIPHARFTKALERRAVAALQAGVRQISLELTQMDAVV